MNNSGAVINLDIKQTKRPFPFWNLEVQTSGIVAENRRKKKSKHRKGRVFITAVKFYGPLSMKECRRIWRYNGARPPSGAFPPSTKPPQQYPEEWWRCQSPLPLRLPEEDPASFLSSIPFVFLAQISGRAPASVRTEQFCKPNLMKSYSTQAPFSYAKDYSSYIYFFLYFIIFSSNNLYCVAAVQKRTARISHYSPSAFRKSSLFPFESVVFILLYSFCMYAHINERGNPNLSTVSAVSFKCIDP